MNELQELLKGAETFKAAFVALQGKTLFAEGIPSPPRFTIIETKSDYFIGLWKGNSKEAAFFAPYDLQKVYSLTE